MNELQPDCDACRHWPAEKLEFEDGSSVWLCERHLQQVNELRDFGEAAIGELVAEGAHPRMARRVVSERCQRAAG